MPPTYPVVKFFRGSDVFPVVARWFARAMAALVVLAFLALVVVTYSPPAPWRRVGFGVTGSLGFAALIVWTWAAQGLRLWSRVAATVGFAVAFSAYLLLLLSTDLYGRSPLDTGFPYFAAGGFALLAIAGQGLVRLGALVAALAMAITGPMLVVGASNPDAWPLQVLRAMDVLALLGVACLAWPSLRGHGAPSAH